MSTRQLALAFPNSPAHLGEIFATAHRLLRPRSPAPRIAIQFFPFAGINHTAKLNDGKLSVRISDLFDVAPTDVHLALALILLSKLYRKKVEPAVHRTYRAFILREDIQERAREIRTKRGRRARPVKADGVHVDLAPMFDRLNAEYFQGQLERPRLSWSAKRSRHILGRYDATHQTIFISRLFDSPKIPLFVTEYIMYHEMLHLRHRTEIRDCRMIVHTAEFRNSEKQFAQYAEAKKWLRSL